MNKIYNEDIYLNGQTQSLELFKKRRLMLLLDSLKESKECIEVIDNYNKLVDETTSLLKLLDISDPIEYSLALSYLIHNGYLSVGNSFKLGDTSKELKSCLGVTIVYGQGCCRHFADMHKSIMDRLNLFCKKFYCYYSELTSSLRVGKNNEANHVISSIEFDNNIYGIDLYNNDKLFKFINKMQLKGVSFGVEPILTYKPYYEIIYGESDIERIKNNISYFERISKNRSISAFIYEDELRNNFYKYLNTKKGLFYEFSEEVKELKMSIGNYK